MNDFFMKTTVTDEEREAYHNFGWLTSNLVSIVLLVDVPIVHGSTILYFESQLITGLGPPPSKFLATILNFLSCELVHFNPNASLHSAASPCCVNAGWELRQIPVCSSITIP
jgi:hypothetical protein